MFNGSENYPAPQEGMDTPTNPPDMGRKYGPTGIIAGFFEGLRQKALLGKLEKTRQFEDKRRAITAESRQAADQARIDSEKQN